MDWPTIAISLISACFAGYYFGSVAGAAVPQRQIAVLRRTVAQLTLDVADVEALSESLRASHKRLASREYMAARRAKAKDDAPTDISDDEEWKKQTRIKLAHKNLGE